MIACPNCQSLLPASYVNTGQLHPCPGCRSDIRVDGYVALLQKEGKDYPRKDNLESKEVECFFHPGKKAIVPCDICGRMLCRLCQVELNGQNLCMNCLKIGKDKHKISTLQDSRILYDEIALALAIWPLLMFFITVVTAPAAVYFAIRHLRTPVLVLPKKRFKSVLALLMATGQIVGWIIFFVKLLG